MTNDNRVSLDTRTHLLHERVDPHDRIDPLPARPLFVPIRLPMHAIHALLLVLVDGDDDACKGRVRKDGPLAIEEPVARELDAGLDNPAERAEVVVRYVRDQEGVVGQEFVGH